mmetsp:Transcript_42531/g.73987  ORF Transcript_42531/g.73987 Transcript_42531/m.73987 type:complete len:217 (-) Transcript_42531:650-1300(-)
MRRFGRIGIHTFGRFDQRLHHEHVAEGQHEPVQCRGQRAVRALLDVHVARLGWLDRKRPGQSGIDLHGRVAIVTRNVRQYPTGRAVVRTAGNRSRRTNSGGGRRRLLQQFLTTFCLVQRRVQGMIVRESRTFPRHFTSGIKIALRVGGAVFGGAEAGVSAAEVETDLFRRAYDAFISSISSTGITRRRELVALMELRFQRIVQGGPQVVCGPHRQP